MRLLTVRSSSAAITRSLSSVLFYTDIYGEELLCSSRWTLCAHDIPGGEQPVFGKGASKPLAVGRLSPQPSRWQVASSVTARSQLRSPAAWLLFSQFSPLSIRRDGGEFRLIPDLMYVCGQRLNWSGDSPQFTALGAAQRTARNDDPRCRGHRGCA